MIADFSQTGIKWIFQRVAEHDRWHTSHMFSICISLADLGVNRMQNILQIVTVAGSAWVLISKQIASKSTRVCGLFAYWSAVDNYLVYEPVSKQRPF